MNLLEEISLNDTIGDLVTNKLSDSVKQKIFLVRALIKKSPMLILKEPFFALNENEINKLNSILECRKIQQTIILATRLPHLETYIDSFIFFKNSRVSSILTLNELKHLTQEVAA